LVCFSRLVVAARIDRYDEGSALFILWRCIMVVSIDRVSPVAHLPLVLGVLRKLDVAGLIDSLIVPHSGIAGVIAGFFTVAGWPKSLLDPRSNIALGGTAQQVSKLSFGFPPG
jgi:hypothetical protein